MMWEKLRERRTLAFVALCCILGLEWDLRKGCEKILIYETEEGVAYFKEKDYKNSL